MEGNRYTHTNLEVKKYFQENGKHITMDRARSCYYSELKYSVMLACLAFVYFFIPFQCPRQFLAAVTWWQWWLITWWGWSVKPEASRPQVWPGWKMGALSLVSLMGYRYSMSFLKANLPSHYSVHEVWTIKGTGRRRIHKRYPKMYTYTSINMDIQLGFRDSSLKAQYV